MLDLIFVLLAAYVIGAVPWAYLLARWGGHDIYRLGDGNVGAHNVMRHVGRGWGTVALALDAAKGMLAVALANAVGGPAWLPVATAVVAVLGHNYPLWLRGRGGKGLATSMGAVWALFPALAWFTVLSTVVCVALTKNLAFSGAAVGVLLVPAAAVWGYSTAYIIAPLVLLAVMGWRQWPDLRRDWRTAPNKRDLILNRWIRDRHAQL